MLCLHYAPCKMCACMSGEQYQRNLLKTVDSESGSQLIGGFSHLWNCQGLVLCKSLSTTKRYSRIRRILPTSNSIRALEDFLKYTEAFEKYLRNHLLMSNCRNRSASKASFWHQKIATSIANILQCGMLNNLFLAFMLKPKLAGTPAGQGVQRQALCSFELRLGTKCVFLHSIMTAARAMGCAGCIYKKRADFTTIDIEETVSFSVRNWADAKMCRDIHLARRLFQT